MQSIYAFIFILCNGIAADSHTRFYVAVPHPPKTDTSIITKLGKVSLGKYDVGFYYTDDSWYYGPYYFSYDGGVEHGAVDPQPWSGTSLDPNINWNAKTGMATEVSDLDTAAANVWYSTWTWVPTPDCLNEMSGICERGFNGVCNMAQGAARMAGAVGNSVAQMGPGAVQLGGDIVTGGANILGGAVNVLGGAVNVLGGVGSVAIQAVPAVLEVMAQGGIGLVYVIGYTLYGIGLFGVAITSPVWGLFACCMSANF